MCWTGRTVEADLLIGEGMDPSHYPPGTGGNPFYRLWHLDRVVGRLLGVAGLQHCNWGCCTIVFSSWPFTGRGVDARPW